METELYKVRSLSSCMKAAYDMFSTNIRTIFRRTWIPALVFSIFSAIATTIFYKVPFNSLTAGTAIASFIVFLFCIGVLMTSVWFDAIIISLLNGNSMKANLPRVIRLTLLIIGITFAISIVTSVIALIPTINSGKMINPGVVGLSVIISCLIYGVFVIVLLPTLYSSMKYLMEPEQKVFSVLGKPYGAGWRHWGYIFMLCLLAGIIVSIIYLIVGLPMSIITIAFSINAGGLALGDPSGLPGYFPILTFFSSLISSFIMIYVGAWVTIIGYYAYGHIETRERERSERKTAVQKTSTEVEPDFEEVK